MNVMDKLKTGRIFLQNYDKKQIIMLDFDIWNLAFIFIAQFLSFLLFSVLEFYAQCFFVLSRLFLTSVLRLIHYNLSISQSQSRRIF